MSKQVTPYNDDTSSKKEQVTKMFDTISDEYDHLNRVISFGIDVSWRKKVVALAASKNPNRILDVATGTGDLVIALQKTGAKEIIGLDISPNMLEVGKKKIAQKGFADVITMVVGDSEKLPYKTDYFDVITVAFGVRNFENLEKGLAEIHRVLKPGGTLLVLETSVPTKTPFKQGYRLYSKKILPLIGRLFSKDKTAYQYLSESAAVFPYGADFNNILKKIGFTSSNDMPQTFGVATIYEAIK